MHTETLADIATGTPVREDASPASTHSPPTSVSQDSFALTPPHAPATMTIT